MQLQIYIIFEKLWHKMSFKQRLKSNYTMTRFEFSWLNSPFFADEIKKLIYNRLNFDKI